MTKTAVGKAKRAGRARLDWVPAKVGCYWDSAAGGYVIHTRVTGAWPPRWPESGYVLTRDSGRGRDEVGVYKTLKAAQRAAEAIAAGRPAEQQAASVTAPQSHTPAIGDITVIERWVGDGTPHGRWVEVRQRWDGERYREVEGK